MSRSPAKSRNATATKSLKEKCSSIVQLVREKGEKAIGGSSTVTRAQTKRSKVKKGKRTMENLMEGGGNEPS